MIFWYWGHPNDVAISIFLYLRNDVVPMGKRKERAKMDCIDKWMYISFDIQIWSVIGSSSSLEVQGPIEACAPRSSEMTVAPWKCLFSCNCKKLQFFVAKFVKKVFVAKMCKNDVFVAKICNCKIRCFLPRKFANARSALALRGYLAVAASTPTYSSLQQKLSFFRRAFNKSPPAFVELSTKAILLL